MRELDKKKKNEHREYERRLGVFCGSTKNDDILMWSHYSNSHTGFCVGLDFKRLDKFISDKFPNGKSMMKEVIYDEKMPVLKSYNEDEMAEYLISRMITKSIHWEYEKEAVHHK